MGIAEFELAVGDFDGVLALPEVVLNHTGRNVPEVHVMPLQLAEKTPQKSAFDCDYISFVSRMRQVGVLLKK